MPNSWFQFKRFTVHQDRCAMKVTTDTCLFGAFAAAQGIQDEPQKILDVGTGTGLLSLMVAQKNTAARIDAIEKDPAAAAQAKENVNASPWAERINIIIADARTFTYLNTYDCIISNPPFYEKELKSENSRKNTAHHDEGLLLSELLEIIKHTLKPGGDFFLLLPYKRNEEIKKILLEKELAVTQLILVRQTLSHPYFRMIIKGSIAREMPAETSIEEIVIKDETDRYSPAFAALLKDYYLHL